MRRFFSLATSILVLAASIAPIANAEELNNCRVISSARQPVSLGFPIRAERLANFQNPKILVLPYHMSGEPKFVLSDDEKNGFLQAGRDITSYSMGKSKIDFIFSPTIDIQDTVDDMNSLKARQQSSWMSGDFANSTWGFVERVISLSDSNVNYSGINAIILYGQPSVRSAEIAEAMMYTNDSSYASMAQKRKDGSPWAKPLVTSEGEISNAILIFNNSRISTISHEIMHLYGLTDLYGAQNSPRFSLMVDASNKLLPFESWVLGWLPDTSVQCINEIDSNGSPRKFSINYSSGDHSLVIPTGRSTALVVDVQKWEKGEARLFFYALDNEARPPITCFFPNGASCGDVTLQLFGGVGKQLVSPAFNLLVSDNDGFNVEVTLIPKSQIGTVESIQLIAQSELRGAEYVLKARNQAAADKAAADKAAADKAAADKAAADKAAADKAAADKAAGKRAGLEKSIVCVKAKISLKVVGKNPKCPSGFKRKT